MTDEALPQSWHADDAVPDSVQFAAQRQLWRASMAGDAKLRRDAVALQVSADAHRHTYQWEWLGVPVIRLPDDIVVLQELFWGYQPTAVVETGVARGGSLILNASLQELIGQAPNVLGIDIKIYDHTRQDLQAHPRSRGIQLLEADSTSPVAVERTRNFLSNHNRSVLLLDSNHTHDHVLRELRLLAPLLPVGGFVLVADTLVEEYPPGYYDNRPWDRGNNPMTAARAFLTENGSFVLDTEWSRRALVTEFRDGILRRER